MNEWCGLRVTLSVELPQFSGSTVSSTFSGTLFLTVLPLKVTEESTNPAVDSAPIETVCSDIQGTSLETECLWEGRKVRDLHRWNWNPTLGQILQNLQRSPFRALCKVTTHSNSLDDRLTNFKVLGSQIIDPADGSKLVPVHTTCGTKRSRFSLVNDFYFVTPVGPGFLARAHFRYCGECSQPWDFMFQLPNLRITPTPYWL